MNHPRQIYDLNAPLPFVGRLEECSRLTAFWDRSRYADGAYLGLMTGEAGVGKSRLLQETLPAIERAGGAVVHAKLYPHSSTDIVELIGRAVTTSEIRRRLPARKPGRGPTAVTEELRRLSRLRRTLLVLEDLHLLEAEGRRLLENLVRSIADDPIAILCAARPTGVNMGPLLEDLTVERIDLRGLGRADLTDLWLRVFGSDADSHLIERLLETTGGNSLAVRSALRGVVESGALTLGDHGAVVADPLFTHVARRKVSLFAKGLMGHLTPEEKNAAAALAHLGEVFARETAEMLLPDADAMLARLIDKQIVSTMERPVMPLVGFIEAGRPFDRRCDYPTPTSGSLLLSFTHTLLHRELLAEGPPSWPRLARAVARNMPLYSLVPTQYVGEMIRSDGTDPEDLRLAFHRICVISHHLNEGPGWRSAVDQAEAAGTILNGRPDLWPEYRDLMEAELLLAHLITRRRSFTDPDYQPTYERLDRLTADPTSAEMASYRFAMYNSRIWMGPVVNVSDLIAGDIESMLARFPELRAGSEYLLYLKMMALITIQRDPPAARRLEQGLMEFMADRSRFDRYRTEINALRLSFLNLYESRGEMELRREQLGALIRELGPEHEATAVARCRFLGFTGRLEDAAEVATALARQLAGFEANGYGMLNILSMRSIALSGFEPDLTRVETDIRELHDRFVHREGKTAMIVSIALIAVGLMRGETAWLKEISSRPLSPGVEFQKAFSLQRLQMNVLSLDASGMREDLDASRGDLPAPLHALLLSMIDVLEERAEVDTALRSFAEFFERDIVRLPTMVYLHAIIALIERCRESSYGTELAERAAPIVGSALRRWLEWLAERSLFVYIRLLIERYGTYLDAASIGSFLSRAEAMERERRARLATESDARIEVSMLDTIGIVRPGREVDPLRGARMRTLLGLMTADRMMTHPLSHNDFIELIAGEEGTVEHPRKVMNLTVFRLREALGADAVLTDSDTPRLNTGRVRIDLLEADALARRADRHLFNGDLARAVPAITEALEIIDGRTPFPGLYDRFFEAMREDLENRLRATTLNTARLALRRDDPDGAERVLRPGVAALPGDEELADLLAEALRTMNRRAEAERLTARVA